MSKTYNKSLIDYKFQFVLRDLDRLSESLTRHRNTEGRVMQSQGYIILALITLSTTLIISKNIIWPISCLISFFILLINLVFIYLDLRIRWRMYIVGKKAEKIEELLKVKETEDFEYIIKNWKFGLELSEEIIDLYPFKKIWEKIIYNRDFYLWHFFFIILSFIPIFVNPLLSINEFTQILLDLL